MMWLYAGHLLVWWLTREDFWFFEMIFFIFDFVGASGFLFVSGVSTALSYKSRRIKAQTSEDYTEKIHRNEYFLRAFLLFIASMIFNIVFGWFWYNKIINIWRWYILLTITFSLIMAWPFLKTSKLLRIIVGITLWVFNAFLINFLSPHEGEFNFYGITFYILYHNLRDDPILGFFTFFLIGTVFGDIIFEMNHTEDKKESLSILKKKMILPVIIMAPIAIIIGICLNFPDFFRIRDSFSWEIYTLGLEMILFTFLFSIEEFELIRTEKSYRFLYYFSYYSLSVFIFHYPLALLFYHQLSLEYIWIYIILSVILAGLLLRFLHNKIEGKYSIFGWRITFSVKVQISRTSQNIIRKRANRLNAQSNSLEVF